jgi:hypothetical protein
VTSLVVTFSEEVTLGDEAFEVRDAAGYLIGAAVNVTTATVNGQTVATLTFSGDGLDAGSLSDGRYTLTVRADGVTGDDGGVMAADRASGFHRLFGDLTGDALVDADDFVLFANAYLSNPGDGSYDPAADFDGLNGIDADDFVAFANRYLTSI